MREIKFRGKRVDNGEWVYGYYFHEKVKGEDYIIETFDEVTGYNKKVLPETVGQYTGLKDKNGREIYEGDIVKGHVKNSLLYYVVDGEIREYGGGWDKDFVGVVKVYTAEGVIFGSHPFTEGDFSALEIIGNIYDNPELLKEEV